MRALVLWCRWHNAKLRLMGRDGDAVWGELGFADQTEPFRFQLLTNRLTIGKPGNVRDLLLDEMGVELTAPGNWDEDKEA